MVRVATWVQMLGQLAQSYTQASSGVWQQKP